ncbi:MAG: ABC transporter substrate binding protein [Lentisphaerota bacterium]
MKKILICAGVVLLVLMGLVPGACAEGGKLRIFVVSSYHREYLWTQDTNKGLCAAFKDFKFLDSDAEVEEFTKNDAIETATVVIKKAWMDTKRKNKKEEIAATTTSIMAEINAFKPDLVFQGDDNATNFIGAHLIDTAVPVVFWGVDFNPMTYGYLDSMEHPGHNVTGVYQSGETFAESLKTLKKLFPDLKTFAILSDASETGKAKSAVVTKLAEEGKLPLQLVDSVATNSFSEWQDRALDLQGKVDAFFIVNHNTLKDNKGDSVDSFMAGAWYLANIKKPEAVPEGQFVKEGMLVTVDDSGYKQAYEAGRMADMILHQKKSPAEIAVIAPTRGAIMVNRQRAAMLGLDVSNKDFIEEFVEKSAALEKYPQ